MEIAWQRVRGPLRLKDVLYQAERSGRIAPLQVVRADRIAGPDHLEHAATLAGRAIGEGRQAAQRVEVEFLRYLAGERQIKHAVSKMGVADGTMDAVVVGLGPKARDAVRHFVHQLGLVPDDAPLATDDAVLANFGITATQIEATTPERRADLVLEAVASVDLG